ncbi:hypothetical protein [Myxococcus sp. AM009]|uniref:hypothetical protein n=1 Tax=Myxococcus sp. AM009 TaxID=2745137 RepID=UPI0020CD833E|nr:hypothetical protein [Myxococcus sp. AM009]
MSSLRSAVMDGRVAQLVTALLEELSAVEPAWTRERLVPVVRRVVDRGIFSLDDVRVYVRLAESLGDDFESQRPHAWMRSWLDDASVSDPVARLHRVVRERRRREDLAAQNERKEAAFRLRHATVGKGR